MYFMVLVVQKLLVLHNNNDNNSIPLNASKARDVGSNLT